MLAKKRPLGLAFTFISLIALLAVGLFMQLGGGGAGATSTTPDKLIYSQQNGSKGQYLQYVPGDNSKVTTQSVTGAGGCATPNTAAQPILAFSAKSYPNGYDGASQNAIVGAYNSRTGVCSTPQAWSIEVGEGLIFAPGPNPLTSGRVFSSASLFIEREDKAGGTLQGRMLEKLGGTVVGTKNFSITTNASPIPATNTGNVPTGFDQLEIQVLSPAAGSISVVGPTSTFIFANKICPGESISDTSTGGTQTTGEVSVTITYASGSGCKSYTDFHASSTDIASSDGKSMTFLSQPLAGAHITIHIDWGNTPLCRSDATSDPNLPACPTSLVDLGSGPVPEAYCAAATVSQPVCSTFKQFTNIPDPANAANSVTHEVEDFDAIGDIYIKR
jgi:hypothetical protein